MSEAKFETKITAYPRRREGQPLSVSIGICQLSVNDMTEIVIGDDVYAVDSDELRTAVAAANAVRGCR